MGPAVYDSSIRPAGINGTGEMINITIGNDIPDIVMGPAVYDSRIRPAGINGTGE